MNLTSVSQHSEANVPSGGELLPLKLLPEFSKARRQWKITASLRSGMSTQYNAVTAEKDPKNKLYWRFNRRRMEAEEVRDSVLAVGNQLQLAMGGQLMTSKNRAYVTGTGSITATTP